MRRRIDTRREDGVAMTEFAIIAPVFLLLVVGLLVFGRMFFYWIEANHLANETVRWAVVDNNPYDSACENGPWLDTDNCRTLQQAARSSATTEFKDRAEVCIDYFGKSQADLVIGDPIRVKVYVPVTFAEFFGFGITIRGAATMRVESFRGTDPVEFSDALDPATGNIGTCT